MISRPYLPPVAPTAESSHLCFPAAPDAATKGVINYHPKIGVSVSHAQKWSTCFGSDRLEKDPPRLVPRELWTLIMEVESRYQNG